MCLAVTESVWVNVVTTCMLRNVARTLLQWCARQSEMWVCPTTQTFTHVNSLWLCVWSLGRHVVVSMLWHAVRFLFCDMRSCLFHEMLSFRMISFTTCGRAAKHPTCRSDVLLVYVPASAWATCGRREFESACGNVGTSVRQWRCSLSMTDSSAW